MLIERFSVLEIIGIMTLIDLLEVGIYALSFKLSEDADEYLCAIYVALSNTILILIVLFYL